MEVNFVSYSLLCVNCGGREPDSFSLIKSKKDFTNYSRNELSRECFEIFSQRECSNCRVKGKYSIWGIYCGKKPKQIHIQLQRTEGFLDVGIWDEYHKHLNKELKELPASNPICQLLLRTVSKLETDIERIVRKTKIEINNSINEGINGDTFYIIYEERECLKSNNSNLGEIVYFENNFKSKELENLLLWIEQNLIF